jgi:hypothetical protein
VAVEIDQEDIVLVGVVPVNYMKVEHSDLEGAAVIALAYRVVLFRLNLVEVVEVEVEAEVEKDELHDI